MNVDFYVNFYNEEGVGIIRTAFRRRFKGFYFKKIKQVNRINSKYRPAISLNMGDLRALSSRFNDSMPINRN